jgi:hypothetical protein
MRTIIPEMTEGNGNEIWFCVVGRCLRSAAG